MHLFLTSGQLVHGTAIDDIHFIGAQTLCSAGCVHGHVTAAHDGNLLANADGGVIFGQICLHEVGTSEDFVCREHAQQVLAGNLQELRQTGTGADEHSLIAFFKQLVNALGTTDHGIRDDFHAKILELVDFLCHDCLGQTELGNTIHQHAAGLVEGLENGDGIALASQIASAAQTGRAGTDDSHLVTVGLRHDRCAALVTIFHVIVSHEAFEATNADALALDATHALTLALVLLRADTAAHGGQAVGGGDDLIGLVKVTLGDLGDKLRNTHGHRAAIHALGTLAVEAALGLVNGHLSSVAECHFFKVLVANQRLLLGHRVLIQTHISHAL